MLDPFKICWLDAPRHMSHVTRHTSHITLRFLPDDSHKSELKGFLPLGDSELSLVSACTEEPTAAWSLSLRLQSSAKAHMVLDGKTVTSSSDLKLLFYGPHARETFKVFSQYNSII